MNQIGEFLKGLPPGVVGFVVVIVVLAIIFRRNG